MAIQFVTVEWCFGCHRLESCFEFILTDFSFLVVDLVTKGLENRKELVVSSVCSEIKNKTMERKGQQDDMSFLFINQLTKQFNHVVGIDTYVVVRMNPSFFSVAEYGDRDDDDDGWPPA